MTTRNDTMHDQHTPKRIDPLFNDAFLRIFGSADSAPVTQPLLNAVIRKVGIPEVERVDSISADSALPGGVACKTPRLDVVILADDGRLFDLEAQRRKVDYGAKSMLYAAKLLADNTPKGPDGDYAEVPQVVVVMLLEGNLLFPESKQVISACRMTWEVDGQPKVGPGNIELVVAELDKVRDLYNKSGIAAVLEDESLAWLFLLTCGYKHPEEADLIMGNFPTMEEFATRYGIAVDDPDLKRAYDRYWMSEMEYNSIMNTARKDGFAEGREEGHADGFAEGKAEGHADGYAVGLEEGRESGIEQGIEQAIADLKRAGLSDAADFLASSRPD